VDTALPCIVLSLVASIRLVLLLPFKNYPVTQDISDEAGELGTGYFVGAVNCSHVEVFTSSLRRCQPNCGSGTTKTGTAHSCRPTVRPLLTIPLSV